jgi:hypothetical protein
MLRPKIQAPIFENPRAAKSSPMPVVPLSPPNICWNVHVAKAHSCNAPPPTPGGSLLIGSFLLKPSGHSKFKFVRGIPAKECDPNIRHQRPAPLPQRATPQAAQAFAGLLRRLRESLNSVKLSNNGNTDRIVTFVLLPSSSNITATSKAEGSPSTPESFV